jgi:hypothetical protein
MLLFRLFGVVSSSNSFLTSQLYSLRTLLVKEFDSPGGMRRDKCWDGIQFFNDSF